MFLHLQIWTIMGNIGEENKIIIQQLHMCFYDRICQRTFFVHGQTRILWMVQLSDKTWWEISTNTMLAKPQSVFAKDIHYFVIHNLFPNKKIMHQILVNSSCKHFYYYILFWIIMQVMQPMLHFSLFIVFHCMQASYVFIGLLYGNW